MAIVISRPTTVRVDAANAEGCRAARLRVLGASSGTSASERAVAVAAAIADEHDGELFVVHVTAPVTMRVTRLGPTVARPKRLDDPYAEPVLLRARRVAWRNRALARVVLMDGDPVEAILAAAEDLRVDLMVIGARAVRAPAFIAAPTRHRLQRDTTMPVLTVALDPHRPPRGAKLASVIATARSS